MELSQTWYIYMRNQKLKTELAYKSAKCNTLRQCGVITDLSHVICNQRGVLFVAHKAVTARTSKISSCLSHIYIFLMLNPVSTGVSRERRKITTTTSFGVRRNRYKTDKIAFLYSKDINFWFKLAAFKRERSYFIYLLWTLYAKPEIHRPDVFVKPPVSHSTDCQA